VNRQLGLLFVAVVGSVALHGGLAYALKHLSQGERVPPAPPMQVTFEVKKEPPPAPPEPETTHDPPPPEPKVAAPPKKVASTTPPKAPPKVPPPPNEPPPPAGPDEAPPAPQRIVVKLEGQTYVNPGAAGGTATGRPGGTGQGPGGGGPEGSTGTGKVAMATSVKVLPKPIGEYDYSKDYPAEALRQEVEGDVVVRLLIDATGHVAQKKLVRGLGFGLDEKALSFAADLRFEPARDESDQPVATWIPWTFRFKLPR
jgi:periplasmic protein TonB